LRHAVNKNGLVINAVKLVGDLSVCVDFHSARRKFRNNNTDGSWSDDKLSHRTRPRRSNKSDRRRTLELSRQAVAEPPRQPAGTLPEIRPPRVDSRCRPNSSRAHHRCAG
jgi:hypothetical protein